MTVNATCSTLPAISLRTRLQAGVIGGLVGGGVFGIMMWKMGMLTMIASMLGSDSVWVGVGVHLMMSMMFGALAGVILPWMPSCPGQGLMFAFAFGSVLWMAGPLVAMPLMTGGRVFDINTQAAASLMGHVVFAVVTLYTARAIASRRSAVQ